MNKETAFLKIVLILMTLPVLILCIWPLPGLLSQLFAAYPAIQIFHYPAQVFLYLSALCYFYAVYQAYLLLTLIDKNDAFSPSALRCLVKIKGAAFVVTGIYICLLPLFYYIGEIDDAPGVILIGCGMIFVAFVVGVFALVLQRLMANGMELKNENDLTI